jgi:hypothetical protein
MVLPETYAAGKSVSPASDQSARQVKTSSEARKIECFEPDRLKVLRTPTVEKIGSVTTSPHAPHFSTNKV